MIIISEFSVSSFIQESCNWELNSGPLPYQGSALPLSYYSELWAENGAQTRDPQLGRLVLYQLSYFRETSLESGCWWIRTTEVERQQIYSLPHLATLENTHLACAWFPILIGFRLSLSPKLNWLSPFLEPLVGFEPTTPRLQITCSGQLS